MYPVQDLHLLNESAHLLKKDGSVFRATKHDLVLMQFTGLLDRDGKEIYEGDIFDMGVVLFDRGCFNGCYTESRNNEQGWDYSDSWEDGLYNYASKNAVKGNIYETPELLKV